MKTVLEQVQEMRREGCLFAYGAGADTDGIALAELAESLTMPKDVHEALTWIRDQGAGDTVGVYDRARFLARRLLS